MLLGLLRSAATTEPEPDPYLVFRDEFSDPRAAGSVDGTTAPGTDVERTVVDTGSRLSIAGGELAFAGGGSAGDPGLWYPSQGAPAPGDVVIAYLRAGGETATGARQIGLFRAQSGSGTTGAILLGTGAGWYAYINSALTQIPLEEHSSAPLALVVTDEGVHLLWRPGSTWRRLAVIERSAPAAAVYPGATIARAIGDSLRDVAVCAAPDGGWATHRGTADTHEASPTIPYTGTAPVDAIVALDWTVGAGETLEIELRRQDADNYLAVRCDQSAGTIRVYQSVAGSEAELGSSQAQTWTVGAEYTVAVALLGRQVSTLVGTGARHVLADASIVRSGTGLTVSGAATVADLAVYDADVTEAPFDRPAAYAAAATTFLPLGDSKTEDGGDGGREFPPEMINLLESSPGGTWDEQPYRVAYGGWTVAALAANLPAWLAAREGSPSYAMINIGANDYPALPAEATWKADLVTVLDLLRAEYPDVVVGVMRVWRRGYDATSDTVSGWIADVVAGRADVHLGPDERVFLKGDDDGASLTDDGLHPNTAGVTETAAQWAMWVRDPTAWE